MTNASGDILNRRELLGSPGVYQCGCRWQRAEAVPEAYEKGARGDLLTLCPIHAAWNDSDFRRYTNAQLAK